MAPASRLLESISPTLYFCAKKSTNLKSKYKKVSRETFVRKSRAYNVGEIDPNTLLVFQTIKHHQQSCLSSQTTISIIRDNLANFSTRGSLRAHCLDQEEEDDQLPHGGLRLEHV